MSARGNPEDIRRRLEERYRRLADARKMRPAAAVAARFIEIDGTTLGGLVSIQLFTTVIPLPIIVRYRTNHAAPRSSRWPSPNCTRRQALAKIPAMVIDIGIPHTRNPATPMNVQLDRNAEESPNTARTRSVSGYSRPPSRMKSVPGLAFSAKPEM